jgi:hypothetical protein
MKLEAFCAVAAGSLLPLSAYAQTTTANADTDVLSEIVVTAQKRSIRSPKRCRSSAIC